MTNKWQPENYVAETWRILTSGAAMPTLRNIIRAATYKQHRAAALAEWRELAA